MSYIQTAFNLTREPFQKSISRECIYQSKSMRNALNRLQVAVETQSFAVFTGEVGLGKTTAIRCLKESLKETEYEFLYISDSKVSPKWLYSTFLAQLGVEPKIYNGNCKRLFLNQLRMIRDTQHKKVIAVADECHLWSYNVLEELRFLLNEDFDSKNPLTLILVGQGELWDKLNMNRCRAIRQRVDLNICVCNLDKSEIEGYIKAHLKYAGAKNDVEIFDKGAIDAIYEYSVGVPRLVNKICKHSLLRVIASEDKIVTAAVIKDTMNYELKSLCDEREQSLQFNGEK
mgnify:FL=1